MTQIEMVKPSALEKGRRYSVEEHPDDDVWVTATYLGSFRRHQTTWAIFDTDGAVQKT